MHLSISNIAWRKEENLQAINILKKFNIKYLEFAPTLLKQYHNNISFKKIKKYYSNISIKTYSMQSILYNKKEHFMFGTKIHKKNLIKEVKKKIDLGKFLGVKIIVFGSPNIKKNILNKKLVDLWPEAIDFFKIIEKDLKKNKITMCIEGNPKSYGGDYITDTVTALEIVKTINSKYLKLNLDMGTTISNKENIEQIIKNNLEYIGHVQLSLPKLKPIHTSIIKIINNLTLLKKFKYKRVISIEQLFSKKNNIIKIEKIINKIVNLI